MFKVRHQEYCLGCVLKLSGQPFYISWCISLPLYPQLAEDCSSLSLVPCPLSFGPSVPLSPLLQERSHTCV